MQQQRLFEITHLLIERGQTTAAALAQRFEVSRRTIYRDIEALSAAGIPVYTDRGKGGGIRILPEYILDKSLFSKQEQAQMMAHFQSLVSLGTPGAEPTLQKLAALFGRRDAWLEVDFAPWGGGEETRALFVQLRDAILQHRLIRFSYTAVNGSAALREVEPQKIVFRGQGWYLYGYARERADFRYFKLSRMQALQVDTALFEPHSPPPLLDAAPYTGNPLELLLRFVPQAAARVYDEFPAEQVEKMPDGRLQVRCQMPNGDWLPGYLLSFGPQAEILAPAFLREQLRQAAAALLQMYT